MKDLKTCREEIDAIDKEIIALFVIPASLLLSLKESVRIENGMMVSLETSCS